MPYDKMEWKHEMKIILIVSWDIKYLTYLIA